MRGSGGFGGLLGFCCGFDMVTWLCRIAGWME